MSRKSPSIDLLEQPGSQYPDLKAAQRSAVKNLAPSLAESLRELMALGWLVAVDGRIIPNPERRL